MTETARDLFVTGLRNAHAMEIQARELMERQSGRLDDFPEVKRRITDHLEETHRQIERLEQCLQECGGSSSTLKDTAQSIIANTMALIHSAADDEILKNTFANNAFENFEIAAYKSLLEMCKEADAQFAREPLLLSLKEEQAMANWIDQNVEKVTRQFLAHKQGGQPQESPMADTIAG